MFVLPSFLSLFYLYFYVRRNFTPISCQTFLPFLIFKRIDNTLSYSSVKFKSYLKAYHFDKVSLYSCELAKYTNHVNIHFGYYRFTFQFRRFFETRKYRNGTKLYKLRRCFAETNHEILGEKNIVITIIRCSLFCFNKILCYINKRISFD